MSEQKQSENSDKEKGIDQKLRWIEIIEYQEQKKDSISSEIQPELLVCAGHGGNDWMVCDRADCFGAFTWLPP